MQLNPFQSLVNLLSNILEAYTTAFFIVDPKTRQLKLAAVQSLSKFLTPGAILPLEQSGILAQVHKVAQTVHMDKLQESPAALATTLPFYREGESHIKGLFAIPVGDGAGVLYVDTKYSWGFNDKQQKWIKDVATVLGEMLEKHQNLAREESNREVIDFWNRLDHVAFKGYSLQDYCQFAVSECAQLLGADYGFLARREPQEPHFTIFAATQNAPRGIVSQRTMANQGLIGWVFQNQKPLVITRLNPDTGEHFLFSSSEGLPHNGSLWAIPTRLGLGHTLVLAFLSRKSIEWSEDYQNAVQHLLHFIHLIFEQSYLHEECEHLGTFDHATGLFNPLVFEARVDGTLTASMHNSTPFTFCLVQFEPWQLLFTKLPPKQVRQWQESLVTTLCGVLPPEAQVGQLADNRFGILFPGLTAQEVRHSLSRIAELGQQVIPGKSKGIRLQPYSAAVGFPQDGTRTDELWLQLHSRLFAAFRGKAEGSSP